MSSVLVRPNNVVRPSFAAVSAPTTSFRVPPPGANDSIVPDLGEEEEDGTPGSWRPAVPLVPAIKPLLSGVAIEDGVARGRVEELLDPLEEIERCRGSRPAADALPLELDEGLPATTSRKRGDGVPCSAETVTKAQRERLIVHRCVVKSKTD